MNKEIELLDNIYNTFDKSEGIIKKYNHMFRVSSIAGRIAEENYFEEDRVLKAKICGLFHDIGRFKQLAEYNTYDDLASIDHGDAGYDKLEEIGYDDNVVKMSTKYHNKMSVPNTLDNEELLFAYITRDADKIDIMETQGLVNNEDNYKITDHIIESFINRTQVDKSKIKYEESKTEEILIMLAFIFDIHYDSTLDYLYSNGVIKSKLDLIKDKLSLEDYILIEKAVTSYIDERLGY